MGLDALKRQLAQSAFGMTLDEAHAQGVCIRCKTRVSIMQKEWRGVDLREYQISGQCPSCFAKLMDEAFGPEERT